MMILNPEPGSAVVVAPPKKGLIRRSVDVVRHKVHKNGLEGNLEFYLNAARSHEANGVAQGNVVYQILYQNAVQEVETYTKAWNVTMENMIAGYPALAVLQYLARKPEEESVEAQLRAKQEQIQGYIKLGVIGAAVLPLIWGFMSGMAHNMEYWITWIGGSR